MKNLPSQFLEKEASTFGLICALYFFGLAEIYTSMQFGLRVLALVVILVVIVFFQPSAIRKCYRFEKNCSKKAVTAYTPNEFSILVSSKKYKNNFLLGEGFQWAQEKCQAAHDFNLQEGKLKSIREQGGQWIHALSKGKLLSIPEEDLHQHVLLVGGTGCGKTKAIINIAGQAISHDWCLIVIDPKGDKSLFAYLKKFCELNDREFKFFSQSRPSESCPINLLANFGGISELASRLAQVLSGGKNDEAFKQMCEAAVRAVLCGMEFLREKPTPISIQKYISQRTQLAVRVMMHWLVETGKLKENEIPAGHELSETFESLASKCSLSDDLPPGILTVIDFAKKTDERLDKTISGIKDTLAKLTSGGLGPLLSQSDENERVFTDTRKLIERKDVFYLATETLHDPSLAQTLGALFLGDLAAVAGDIYDYRKGDKRKIMVIVDEASDVCCPAMISLLSKARGAGFSLVLATQSIVDFSARLGSSDEMNRILANIKTRIVMGVQDNDTRQWFASQGPKVSLFTRSRSRAISTRSKDLLLDGMALGDREIENIDTPLVAPELYGCLPKGEAFVTCGGNNVFKVRVPYIRDEKLEKEIA